MFRKFTDRIQAAASSAANALSGTDANTERGVQSLQSMGFSANDARNALQAAGGDVDRAAEFLLASGTPSFQPQQHRPQQTHNNNTAHTTTNQAEMDRALQASLEAEEQRQLEAARKASAAAAQKKKSSPASSAAATKAGQAAVKRAAAGQNPFPTTKNMPSGKVSSAHPDVKVPLRLSRKPKEEQLLRCADRLKSNPRAVDTIYIALTSIQKDPDNDRFRKIEKTTAGYQRTLAKAPGAEDMFKAMNFAPRGTDTLVLQRDQVDAALLYLGISALDTTRQTPEYLEAKRKLQFEKQLRIIFSQSDASEEEAIKRANHMSKCPSEPSGGRGALITVKIGTEKEPVRRKFDGDDCLEDILNFLGGVSSAIPEKLLTREWSLVDLNRYPLVPTDCEEDRNKTLQYLGFFPSGRLEVVPSTDEWHSHKQTNAERGSARGLGAAPR